MEYLSDLVSDCCESGQRLRAVAAIDRFGPALNLPWPDAEALRLRTLPR